MPDKHVITPESIVAFLASELKNAASANMISRLSCAARALYDYLPEDKTVSFEKAITDEAWLNGNSGYADEETAMTEE